MIGIIDYGMGNLHSVKNALDHIGAEAFVSADPQALAKADKWILPGVGAFPDAMRALSERGLDSLLYDGCRARKPLLGICLGMQLLFEESMEFGKTKGLGLIGGRVIPIDAHGLKIPHIGWNSLDFRRPDDPLLRGLSDGTYVYFVHSFRADTGEENIVADTFYGERVPALVRCPGLPVWGAQFHPEKSHAAGLSILRRFAEYKEEP